MPTEPVEAGAIDATMPDAKPPTPKPDAGRDSGVEPGYWDEEDDAGSGGRNLDAQFVYDAPVRDSALTRDSACASTTAQAKLKPIDMYVMLDRSGSMVEPSWSWTTTANPPPARVLVTGGDCNVGGTPTSTGDAGAEAGPDGSAPFSKWCSTVNALGQYFRSATSRGNRAALSFFPKTDGRTGQCDPGAYGDAIVPLSTLPSSASGPLITALNNATPLGYNTPTWAAARGVAAYTGSSQSAGRQMIGVLITDGVPNACDPANSADGAGVTGANTAPTIAQVLSDHLTATGIKTYVIGMAGADFGVVESLAVGGGSPSHASNLGGTLTSTCGNGQSSCSHWNVGLGDPAVLSAALLAIQRQAVGCSLDMPTTSQGIINPANVEVDYVAGGGATSRLTKQSDAAACGTSGVGWYYSGPPNALKINLCPTTCRTVQDDTAARIDVLTGCLGG